MNRIGDIHPDPLGKVVPRRSRLMCWGRRIAGLVLLSTVVLLAWHWLTAGPQEKLAAFDAAHAVPDEDNAALIYAELLRGEEVPRDKLEIKVDAMLAAIHDPVSLQETRAPNRKLRVLELSEGLSDPNTATAVGSRPWKSAECPELKQWLDKHHNRIDKLQEAARKPACYFPLGSTPGRMSLFDVPLGTFRQHVSLLIHAANNDFGEGNINEAIAKCQALISMGRHLRQQPSALCLTVGIVCEAAGRHILAEFVMAAPAAEPYLDDLAAGCDSTDRDWESLRRDINRVRDICSRLLDDQRPLKFRAYMWYQRVWYGDHGWIEDRTHELYRRMLSERQGLRILIELRRFRDRTGQWPQSLDQVAAALPAGILLDPLSDRPYVYRRSEHGFSLHSVGANRVDEGGRHKWDGPDDWPIWPPRGRTAEPEQKSTGR